MGVGYSKTEKDLGEGFPKEERLMGLNNYGNTCYANSILQSLYHCIPFREFVLSQHNKELSKIEQMNLLNCLSELFHNIRYNSKQIGKVGPRKFIGKLRKVNLLFAGKTQQDAQEFLNFLLNEISDLYLQHKYPEMNLHDRSRQETEIHKIFRGELSTETKCRCCESSTSRKEHFLDLSLDIQENCSLTNCFKQFSIPEKLVGENKYYCECCRSLQEAYKTTRISKLPQILVIHQKRFKYFERIQSHKKLFHKVSLPLEFKILNTTKKCKKKNIPYELFAMVIHKGHAPHFGHYVAIIKSHDKWILMDDERVIVVNENFLEYFFGTPVGESVHNETSYILFYQQMDHKKNIQEQK
ncbi:hypothetical protein M0813_09137 [Anaeramoeba flamelloides]|uniref:ubiquitinyl hydrolase 1 n=1 Tax=Anaeramoeba flamelloides TaxID=1746091 RepID=A0AAV7YCN8_9EUKA|nr:hypothetical protein M0812_28791 [Anaeramoeba flamelloides]KAJ6228308.1 hypothetical protein M0813_09137 [Anaeramoeba flamelloides]